MTRNGWLTVAVLLMNLIAALYVTARLSYIHGMEIGIEAQWATSQEWLNRNCAPRGQVIPKESR